ncbi:MAG: methyl-accepting chemotaxis protein [Candidatus Omnitrophota bacterium]
MFKFLPNNLEFKILLWMGIGLFLVMGMTTVYNINSQSRIFSDLEIKLTRTLTTSGLNAIYFPMLSGKQEEVEQVFSFLAKEPEIQSIFLANHAGLIKRTTDKSKLNQKIEINQILEEAKQHINLKNQGIMLTKIVDKGKKILRTYVPVKNSKDCQKCHADTLKILGVLGIDFSRDNFEKSLGAVKIQNVLILLFNFTAIMILLIILLRKVVIKPINILIKTAMPAAEGDLTKGIPIISQDEIGILAGVFNSIIKNLHKMVKHIQDLSGKVSSFAEEISSSTKEMNASTEEISSTIQKIANGVSTQAKRVEDTSSLMEDMADSVRSVAENAQAATKSSERSLEQAKTGGKSTTAAVETMNKITDTVMNAATVVLTLGEKTQQIGQITETITNIADQTNLLALNAAIEAARAGDAGRGFAVVAEEVRKLAEGSAEAARRIGILIKGIQVETPKAVASMEAGTKEVTEGREIVKQVSNTLIDIINAAKISATMVNEITMATQNQLANSQEIVKAVDEVAVVAEESATAAQEASSSSEEQTASMQELTASAEELARLASDLKDLVGKFKLSD